MPNYQGHSEEADMIVELAKCTAKKEKRKAGTIKDVKALVKEARVTQSRKDWRVAALSVLCYFSCRRMGDLIKVRVEDKNRPAGPWEAKGPQWTIAALPCPPCEAPVEVTCLGGHETALWPCHSAKPASCGRKCGRQLPCENCTCSRDCHRVRGVEDAVKVCRDLELNLDYLVI